MMGRGQGTDIRCRMSDVRGQGMDIRCRMSDVGGQKTDVGGQISEEPPSLSELWRAKQRTEVRCQRSDIGGRRAEGRIQTSEDRRQGWIWGRIKIVIEEDSRGQGFKGSSERVK